MLVVNEEVLKPGKEEYASNAAKYWGERYTKFFNQCKKKNKSVYFLYTGKESYSVDKGGRMTPDKFAPVYIPATCTRQNNVTGETEKWAYSKKTIIPGERPESYLISKRQMAFDPQKDYEIIFFLQYISPQTAGNNNYTGLNIPSIKFDNREKAAEQRVKEKKKAIQFDQVLYSDLYFSETNPQYLQEYCKSLGFDTVDEKTYGELIEELETYVRKEETNRNTSRWGIEEFIQEVTEGSDNVKLRAYMHIALKAGYIEFDPLKSLYFFSDGRGSELMHISKVPQASFNSREKMLFEVLSEREDLRQELYNFLNVKEDPSEKYKTMSYPDLKKLAADKGIEGTTKMKKDDIIKELIKKDSSE